MAGEGQVDTVVGAALGDEGHGAEQGIDAHLHPALALDEGPLQQGVVDVVAGIALVTAQIDGPVDVDGQIRVHLDQAEGLALVPVVARPRLVVDELQGEGLVGRQGHVALGARLALGDGGPHHRLQPFLGNDIPGAEGGDSVGQGTFARNQGVDARQDRIIARQGAQFGPHPEQGLSLVGEVRLLSLQHPQPRRGGRDVGQQIGPPLPAVGVQTRFRKSFQPPGQGDGALGQLGQGARIRLGRLGPFGRAVIGVDIARLALADLQRQGHIVPRDGVQAVGRRVGRRLRRRRAGGQQAGAQQGGDGRVAHGNSLSPAGTLGARGRLAKKRPMETDQGLRPPRPCCKHRRPAVAPQTHP